MCSRGTLVAIIIVITVILDQILKVWVKTSFYLGEDMPILSWFHLLFIENNGMAFGMTIGSKLALTLFRIVAVSAPHMVHLQDLPYRQSAGGLSRVSCSHNGRGCGQYI